jgi:hypothetical protein
MDIAIAPPHRPERRSQVGTNRFQDRLPKSQPPGGIPDERRKNVPRLQGHSHRNTQGLLAPAKEDAPKDFARPIQAG